MSWMVASKKVPNPGGAHHGNYRCLAGGDQGILPMEQKRQGHRTVCSSLHALAYLFSRDAVPSETSSQMEIITAW